LIWLSWFLLASRRLLSSSVSLPVCSICTCFPQAMATSRSTRVNLSKTLLMGCMRVLVTEFGGRTGANAQSDRSVFCAAKRRRVLKHGANNYISCEPRTRSVVPNLHRHDVHSAHPHAPIAQSESVIKKHKC